VSLQVANNVRGSAKDAASSTKDAADKASAKVTGV